MAKFSDAVQTQMNRDNPRGPLSPLLSAASQGYRGALAVREKLFSTGVIKQKKARVPVLSIGNLTLGGTGKTPMAIHVAHLLSHAGLKVGIASRGYGGSMQKIGGIVSDGQNLLSTASQAGDEPLLMAIKLPGVPVAVAAERALAAGLLADRFGVDLVILDDGFQHRRLYRDCDLLLADAKKPLGSGRLFPAGTLREPATAAERAHALVLTRSDGSEPVPAFWTEYGHGPVFRCRHEPLGFTESAVFGLSAHASPPALLPLSHIQNRPVAAFSAIAGNAGFFEALAPFAGRLVFSKGFRDHHAFTEKEIKELALAALKAGATAIVTTEKDCVRLNGWSPDEIPVLALSVGLLFHPGPDLGQFLRERLGF
ncbi:MAG: tetraacyldisaccharide 4'-kinase [Thermodesulfobacteriota bacterium]